MPRSVCVAESSERYRPNPAKILELRRRISDVGRSVGSSKRTDMNEAKEWTVESLKEMSSRNCNECA